MKSVTYVSKWLRRLGVSLLGVTILFGDFRQLGRDRGGVGLATSAFGQDGGNNPPLVSIIPRRSRICWLRIDGIIWVCPIRPGVPGEDPEVEPPPEPDPGSGPEEYEWHLWVAESEPPSDD